MEMRVGGETHVCYGLSSTDFRAVGKRNLEWDPNDWRWDGDLFIARRLNPNNSNYQSRQFFPSEVRIPLAVGTSNSSSSCSDEVIIGTVEGKRELEKRRRVIVVDDDNLDDEARNLALNLGGITGKKTKLLGTSSNRAVCQVDDCGANLTSAKDYHRRHKVCEMHSKACRVLVGNVLQRFCQQCSRFHALQEFDEGKRSCRRCLAGHNKRRRKTQPDAVVTSSSLNDDQASGYLLISLLKILSNMHSGISNQTSDHDLLSHLLRSLASHSGLHGDKNIHSLLQESQNLLNNGTSIANSEIVSAFLSNRPQCTLRPILQNRPVTTTEVPQRGWVEDVRAQSIQTAPSQNPETTLSTKDSPPAFSEARESWAGRSQPNNFDLNDVYVDSDDCTEDLERSPVLLDFQTGSLESSLCVQHVSHQSSPPQTSGNSDSASALSPSSSSGEFQSRTDRIVLQLFGKEPSDFPNVLRAQLCCDLTSSFSRLLDASDDETFWRTGWVYTRVQHQIATVELLWILPYL